MSWRNLKILSLDFTEVLDELDEDLEPFDEYLDLTEPFRIFYIKFWCFKKSVHNTILSFSEEGAINIF